MNVEDVKDEAPIRTLSGIFARQRQLMEKYHGIEKASGLMQTEDCPVDLDDPRGQARLKDFAWRTTEEVSEAMEPLLSTMPSPKIEDRVHVWEEVGDAIHFLVELSILSGFESSVFLDGLDDWAAVRREYGEFFSSWTVLSAAGEFVFRLGRAMNCLKLKPWKQTHVATDRAKYLAYLQDAWWAMAELVASLEMDVGVYYARKAKVNAFRQESNY